jgi:hypothetical protein
MPRQKVRRTRDKHRLPLEIRTTKVEEIFREFAAACRKLFADACQKLSEEMAGDGKPASGHTDEYRDVPGFPGYRVNARGRVQSCWGSDGRRVPEEWLTLNPFLGEGRQYVRLTKHGKRYDRQVGALVLRAWKGKPPAGKPRVRHVNKKMDDDTLDNLEWGGRKQQRPNKTR